MNNFDWLIENDRETIINALIGGDDGLSKCNYCHAYLDAHYDASRCNYCSECRREWLLSEHVEPNSWEKIERDVKRGVCLYAETLGVGGGEDCHGDYDEECWSAVALDVFNRCKALADDMCKKCTRSRDLQRIHHGLKSLIDDAGGAKECKLYTSDLKSLCDIVDKER